ncbi:MAG: T9SS type A sorting domain-containing protein, partial [Phaeodactylibacter sp.]|nr:T9SS type A sorting domain-containing protein [Phaeodactylibacter sp.]
PNLSACGVQSICDYLANPDNPATISGNAPSCNSREEVEAACVAGSTSDWLKSRISIFPNPTYGPVQLTSLPPGAVTYKITDGRGQRVREGRLASGEISLSGLPAGVYSFMIQTDEGIVARRVVKL